METKTGKLYYSIGEVAEMLKVSPSLLRFWEKEFKVLQPRKTRKGDRLFTHDDIRNLKLIYHLVKERRYTLEGARKKIRSNADETNRSFQIVETLKDLRQFLVKIKDSL